MAEIVRAHGGQLFEYGPLTVRRLRPESGFTPITRIDLISMKTGAIIEEHPQVNDEILSYVWRGSVVDQHTGGERYTLSAKRTLLINAASEIRHTESAPLYQAEMLQAVIRPSLAEGTSRVQMLERNESTAENQWTLLAGPESSNAPLVLRQDVAIYDIKLGRGETVSVPEAKGLNSWLVVLEGVVNVDGSRLHKADTLSSHTPLNSVTAERDALMVLFIVDDAAPVVASGSWNGQ
ncbi:pirin family protein [Candidatus Pantoea multigeneris]|uniref:Quercetin 2,3-dioxygenase C-terminal cupin domain-containing protein n=1 Tax=Candidatus Pantoea multigeneris TaxID=2608357 RepID=A0ABX0RHZ4_9GAMM|nr:hypothetical protein [Pantoea multigeneris]NIF23763.1 hypothetical protein [Pantoea multigeneris]